MGQFDSFQPSATDPLQQFLRNSAGGDSGQSIYAPALAPYSEAIPQSPRGINSPIGATAAPGTPSAQQLGPAAGAVVPVSPTEPQPSQPQPAQAPAPVSGAPPSQPGGGGAVSAPAPGVAPQSDQPQQGGGIQGPPPNAAAPANQQSGGTTSSLPPGVNPQLQPFFDVMQKGGVQNYNQGWMTPSAGWGG